MEADSYYTSPQDDYVTETISRREDYHNPHEETEFLVDENGVSKTVTKRIVTKTVTEKRVRRVDDHNSLPRSNHPNSKFKSDPSRKYNSVPRNQSNLSGHYEDGDERTGLLRKRSSGSSSAGSESLGRNSGYKAHGSRNSHNEVPRQARRDEYIPEDYGEDDDRVNVQNDKEQYELQPSKYNGVRSSASSDASDQRRYTDQLDSPASVSRNSSKRPFGRPPAPMQEASDRPAIGRDGDSWHTPTLAEVIKMLSYPVPVVQHNSAAYLQHLCFNDNKTKADIRKLGGIPPLIKLLDNSNPAVEINACGALRNLCYGSNNDQNKIEMKVHEGVPAVVRLIRSTKDMDTREQATGTLWNLSAHPELKGQVLELGLEPLSNLIIIPYSDVISKQGSKPKDIVMVDVFTNAVGVVRNLSSTDSYDCRRRLRDCEGLIFALLNFLHAKKENEDIDSKATENCMCVLRNLTYKLQEETPNRELYMLEQAHNADNDTSDMSCFGKSKNKEKTPEVVEQIPPDDPDATGAELLWQPENSRLYVSLLQDTHRSELIEASLGALLNLTYGSWKWAVYARIVVRKEKGLPVLIDRLRTDYDQVVRVGSTTLTNLAEDKKNKELIGKFAMKDLVYKLPGGSDSNIRASVLTTIAILNTIRILVEKNSDNVRYLRDAGGVERITTINNARDSSRFHTRVVKAAGQVLQAVWANKETQSMLKKDGWNKNHFTPTVTVSTLPRNFGTLGRQYADPHNGSSTGGRRSQRNASHSDEEQMNMTPQNNGTMDPNQRRTAADSWV